MNADERRKIQRKFTFLQYLLIFLSLFLYAFPVFGEEKSEIDIREFVIKVLENDPAFQEILIDELTLKYNRDLELPVSDFIMDTTASFSWDPRVSYLKGESSGNISLSRLFPTTGTKVSTGYSVTEGLDDEGKYNIRSGFNAEVRQSILSNAFGKNTRRIEKRIGVENEIARHQIIEACEDYLASLISIYGDWLSSYENVATAGQSLESTRDLVRIVQQKRRARIALPEEVDRIVLELEEAKERDILARENYLNITNQVRAAMGEKYYKKDIAPVRVEIPDPLKSMDSTELETWMEESRTFQMMSLLQKRGLLMVDIARDNMLPSAEVFLGYQSTGTQYDIRTPDQKAYAGITLNMNFGKQVESARLEQARIAQKKVEYTNRSDLYTLKTDLLNLQNRLNQGRKLLDIAKHKSLLARRVLRAEKYNYRIGKADLNDLIIAQNNVVEAGYLETSRVVELHKLNTEWLRLSDRLVNRDFLEHRKDTILPEEEVSGDNPSEDHSDKPVITSD